MKLYISDGAVWLLLVFYLPLALLGLWLLWRSLPKRWPIRIAGLVIGAFIAAAFPLWDVVITSVQMAELCPQAGVTIKRVVYANGFYSNLGGSDDIKRGFNYVEAQRPGNRIEIYTKSGNEIQKQVIDTEKVSYVPKSRYEYIFGDTVSLPEYARITRTRSVARDRVTSEELGYAVRYGAYPGWIDRNTIALFGRFAWNCPTDQDQNMRLLNQVILPSN